MRACLTLASPQKAAQQAAGGCAAGWHLFEPSKISIARAVTRTIPLQSSAWFHQSLGRTFLRQRPEGLEFEWPPATPCFFLRFCGYLPPDPWLPRHVGAWLRLRPGAAAPGQPGAWALRAGPAGHAGRAGPLRRGADGPGGARPLCASALQNLS